MVQRIEHKGNRGFSLVETLAVVAILAILLGLSAVAAAYYRNYLKITELDNAARDIYMAAENRAVLLDSGGQLDAALGVATLAEGGAPASPLVFTKSDVFSKNLLTAGAVDQALLDGEFYIVYDPSSGAVTDVFYTEGPDIQEIGYALSIAGDRDARMGESPMLGYYGGRQEARGDYTPLPAPEVMVVVENGDLLRVHVTFSVPQSALPIIGTNWMFTAEKSVVLEYAGSFVELPVIPDISASPGQRGYRTSSTSSFNTSVTYTWVLDQLDRDDGLPSTRDRHFWQLFTSDPAKAPVCGGDFTVTAEITLSAPGRRSVSASGSDSGNSLFAEHSGGAIAQLENLRHLQNLDKDTSHAGGKTSAVLLADVACCGREDREPYGLYPFKPIVNEELRSFDGGWSAGERQKRRNEITDLCVTADSAKDQPGAGLFAKTGDGMKFTGVRLIDAAVEAGNAPAAGVLVGSAGSGVTFQDIRVVNSKAVCDGGAAGGIAGSLSGTGNSLTDCRVYWEPDQDNLRDLRDLLGSSDTQYLEQIRGAFAGGLVGKLREGAGQVRITGSLAASVILGTERAGGLIGSASGAAVTLERSYADNYLSGGSAAGLIAGLEGSGTISGCYAAGFIDMAQTKTAAGLVLGPAGISVDHAYSVMFFSGLSSEKNTVYRISESQGNSAFDHTYYLGSGEIKGSAGTARGMDYGDMSGSGFLSEIGGGYEFKGYYTPVLSQNTYPYNLQEKQNLTAYSFPGLKGLPHYGDWRAYFKEPSLVYYEQDSRGKIGFSGGNARELIGRLEEDENITVRTDGYAVALMQKDLTEDSFTVTYTCLGEDGKPVEPKPQITYFKPGKPVPGGVELLEAAWERTEGGEDKTDEYWLAPLPDALVIGERTSKDFFQYLRFELGIALDRTNNKIPSGEYFYNSHFAETVNPYVPSEEGKPFIDWDGSWAGKYKEGVPPYAPENAAEAIRQYVTESLIGRSKTVGVSVRTPRHFFHLSQHRDYYHNESLSLSFQQRLTLDGHQSVYTGYRNISGGGASLLTYEDRETEWGFQVQAPIGTQAEPFLGSYNGNSLPIRRLAFDLPKEDQSRVCAGLFGSSNGTLQNIVYSLNPAEPNKPADPDAVLADAPRSIIFRSSELRTYLGALVGVNRSNGTVANCSVDGVNLTTRIYTSEIYIGGLCGMNEGAIQNSAAESAFLHVDASNYGKAFVGGLVGFNENEIRRSYAVGRLAAEAAQENAPVYLGGFAGRNSGSIYDSYSAMHLSSDGVNAESWGFCASPGGGRQSGTYYLNNGNFSYRGEEFLANYAEKGGATSLGYIDLTADPSPVSDMNKIQPLSGQEKDDVFPFPTGVTENRLPRHHGGWPRPLKLGSMGVYYWEELKIAGRPLSYHVSLLAVDPGKSAGDTKTVREISTLSTAHDEGGEVTRFGYGVYNKQGQSVILADGTPLPLLYSDKGGEGKDFRGQYKALEEAKAQALSSSGSPDYQNRLVDEALAKLMSYELGTGFQFHSFHSFSLDASLGGLYPDSDPKKPNGTLTLRQEGKYEDGSVGAVQVTFALNPLFANALAVAKRDGDTACQPNGSVRTCQAQKNQDGSYTLSGEQIPGRAGNPYEVRSIAQLQLIDWNSKTRNVDTVLELKGTNGRGAASFPYLSSGNGTGKYNWKQSYDVKGERGTDGKYKTYTPIAEYYDTTNTNENRGFLDGWFGGVYDGNSYVIENVDVQGHTASCAGLFGLVYNGTLKNIVLYSSTGESFVRSFYDTTTSSQWYAIGALAGVAASHNEKGEPGQTAVVNCAVSGYRIEAKTYTAKADKTWGGVGVGGLLGLSNMSLSGCTSNADIVLRNGIVANDNLRVGGLVGSSQGSIQDCYAGGSISLDQNSDIDMGEKGIYIGGIVGGSYMKPLQIGSNSNLTIGFINDQNSTEAGTKGWTNNSLINCYSYVRLPSLAAHSAIKGLYAIGGTGEIYPSGTNDNVKNHGSCIISNCYFLSSEVLCEYNDISAFLDAAATRKAKTDLKTRAGKPLIDTSYKVGSRYNLQNPVRAANSRFREISGSGLYSSNLYYPAGLPVETGLPLFQLQSNRYVFRGWMVYRVSGVGLGDEPNYNWVYYYTTDPSSFEKPGDGYYDVTGLSYEQLAGTQRGIPGKDPALDIYQLLNAEKAAGAEGVVFFQHVTTQTEDDPPISIPGKYSYPPADSPQLRDRDYPFPTILIKDKKYSVHYGGWPLKGFERRALDENGDPLLGEDKQPVCLGGSPIDIDLFVNGSAPYQEHLVLTEGIGKDDAAGQWSFSWKNFTDPKDQIALVEEPPVKVDSEKLPQAERGKTFLLRLTPLSNGTDDLLITYTDPDGNSYQLTVTVHITADVKLRPSRLFMFPSDTVETGVTAADKADRPLELDNGRLTLKGNPVCGSTGFLEAETIRPEAADGKPPAIRFTTGIPLEAPELESGLSLNANASFRYAVTVQNPDDPDNPLVTNYDGGSGDIRVDVIQPWKGQEEDFIRFDKADGGTGWTCTITFPDSMDVGEGEGTLLFEKFKDPEVKPMLNQPTAALRTEDGKILVTLTYQIPDYADVPEETTVFIPLKLTSLQPDGQPELIEEAEGQIHTLSLTVKKPEMKAPDAPNGQNAIEAPPPALEEEERSVRRRRAQKRNA